MKKNKIAIFLLIALISPLMITEANAAATVADMANTLLANIKTLPRFIVTIAYIMGIVCGIQSALKFKEFNESKGQVKVSVPIYYAIGSALLIGVPLTLQTGLDSFGYEKTDYSRKGPSGGANTGSSY